MFDALPKTITKPLAKGYFPGIVEAQKLVSEMDDEIKRDYVHGDWYEFQSIGTSSKVLAWATTNAKVMDRIKHAMTLLKASESSHSS